MTFRGGRVPTKRAKVCAFCDAPITQPVTGRPRKFCSDRCRDHHREACYQAVMWSRSGFRRMKDHLLRSMSDAELRRHKKFIREQDVSPRQQQADLERIRQYQAARARRWR